MFGDKISVQDQLKEARREQILAAAGEVFAERGYHSAKMKDVATAAGVSNGTVYNYYKSKEELLQALLHRLNETEQREAQFSGGALAEGDALLLRGLMRSLLGHRLGFIGEHAEIFRAILPELLGRSSLQESYRDEVLTPSFGLATAWLEGMMESGQVRQLDAALTARLLASQALGLLVLRLLGDETVTKHWQALPELVTEILCNGLEPREGEAGGS